MFRNIIKHLLDIVLHPFCKNFTFFIYLFCLCSLVDILAWGYYGNIPFAVYFGLHGFVLCYITCFLFAIWPKCNKFSQWIKGILIALGWINVSIDLICHLKLKTGFTYDMVGIILATNKQEAGEFVSTFFSFDIFLWLIVCVCIILTIRKIADHYSIVGSRLRYIFLLIVIAGYGATCIKKSSNWGRVFFLKPLLFMSYELPPSLEQFYSDLSLEVDCTKMPDNICIIIGESFSKRHSSLYGYEKVTNPKLQELEKDSSLVVYKHVTSPGTHTIESLQMFMSTLGVDESQQKKWYEYTTLIEMLSKSGYKTYWISNQSQKGVYDNVASRYAQLCDTSIFVNNFSGTNVMTHDEMILPSLSKMKNENNGVYFIHLMGSHYEFDKRYPVSFAIFNQDDYSKYPKHQRYNLATYDNSIRYNDSIVNEIIKHFNKKESIVYYFSDHGLDIYNSSDDYVGHAAGSAKSIEAGIQIPFLVWMSKEYINNHRAEYEKIRQRSDSIFNMRIFSKLLIEDVGIKCQNIQ